MNYTDFWQKLTKFSNILVGIHINPDGDCMGAALAFKLAAEKMQKNVTLFSYDRVPDYCSFLENTDAFTNDIDRRNFQCLLLLDVNTVERTKIKNFKLPNNIFIIDHHEHGEITYDEELVIPEASSTCEILYNLFKANNIEITKTIAEDLLCGIICDTGAFKHSNTNGNVLKTAGELASLGADPHYITKKYFNEKSFAEVILTGYALDNAESYYDDDVILAYVDYEYLTENPDAEIDSDMVNQLLQTVKGHKITVFMRETDINKVRISLRSPDALDCNLIANEFDGGGHKNAAGLTIRKSLDEAKEDLLNVIEKHLQKYYTE